MRILEQEEEFLSVKGISGACRGTPFSHLPSIMYMIEAQ